MESPREKFLITSGFIRDGCIVKVNELILTNLRNQPLTRAAIQSMSETIPSLYHNLVTGSSSFPIIPFEGFWASEPLVYPFTLDQQQYRRENTPPDRLIGGPAAGILPPPAGAAVRPILTARLPDRVDVKLLRADRRNSVRTLERDGLTVIRVISLVYLSDGTKMENRWRVTDYGPDGIVEMSVLCRFKNPPSTRRKDAETSPVGPPAKPLRL